MDRNRQHRTGKYSKEANYPQRITRRYALQMLHNALVRLTMNHERTASYTEAINILGGLRGQMIADARRVRAEGR